MEARFSEDTHRCMHFYLQTLMLYSHFHYCSCVCECVSVFLSILQNCKMHNIMGGSTKSQKAGRLKRLEAKIVKKPASYRDYVET